MGTDVFNILTTMDIKQTQTPGDLLVRVAFILV